ncbi:ATP-binding protein [Pelistega europaea]|uniref:ATP-binding protein n=1 Tax=Pelistega europaea TaxID=106147 RepID=A0A7Y4LAE5_9BURK|nr:ATP-binding protein [Pelistega europaea]NOL49878.1 ATP-binding protein [Pelistega europaea]
MMTIQNTEKKLLPIGISSFSDLREMDYYYVDKTPLIIDLITSSRFVFLSRPRRFGKSLTLDTMAELFSGNKTLFEGLYAENNWDWDTTYPVIRLSFAGEVEQHDIEELRIIIQDSIEDNAHRLQVPLQKDDINLGLGRAFKKLIQKTEQHYGQKVVVLIDEYDKPIIDNLDNSEIASEVRGLLKSLYSQIKDLSGSIRFAMLTGVSKFGQMSLFSGLNNLEDITLRAKYSALCGYTQEELESVFAPELQGVDLEQVKFWYNGYNWTGESVYNPFDILLFFKGGCAFDNYWMSTGGNASFLMKLLTSNEFSLADITRIAETSDLLASVDVGSLHPIPVLFQTGYLTIDKVFEEPGYLRQYTLKFPNYEVRQSLSSKWLQEVLKLDGRKAISDLRKCLRDGDIAQLQQLIKSAIASIPSDAYRRNNIAQFEGHWQSAIGMFFAGACADFIMEDASSQGRADLVAIEQGNVYIFEFKVKQAGTAQEALEQIKERNYAEKYRAEAKQIFEIGVSFDEATRAVNFAINTATNEYR